MRRVLRVPLFAGLVGGLYKGFSVVNSQENRENQFKFGTHMIPHPKKVEKGGEDAFYVSPGLIAVADGVGGWGDLGVDPGLFSKEFCLNIGKLWTKQSSKFYSKPKQLIVEALKLTKNVGTSTCCILAIDPNEALLRMANIGDSGYFLYRKDPETAKFKCFYVSPDHQRSFNFPYQIGTNGDPPEMSLEKTHDDARTGDVVVMGTDGLLDNVFQEEITEIINKNPNFLMGDLNPVAQEIAEKAFENSKNRKKISPFEKKAKEVGLYYLGGKPDDITVIVAVVDLKKK